MANIHVTLSQAKSIANSVLAKVRDKNYALASDNLSYTVKKQAEADTGYASTYQLFSVTPTVYVHPAAGSKYDSEVTYYADAEGSTLVNTEGFTEGTTDVTPYYVASNTETAVGAKINIPKDMVVSSGEVKVVATANDPYDGAAIGDKYIELTIANAAEDKLYIPVNDLVGVYTNGNGISLSNGEFSINIDNTNANGLAVTAAGLKLGAATADTWGGVAATGTAQADTVYYSDQACTTVANVTDGASVDGLYTFAKTADGTAGAMSSADKYKLDNITTATDAQIIAMIAGLDTL